MKCARANCGKGVRAAGWCHAHHQHAVDSGALTAGTTSSLKARQHVDWLVSQGVSYAEITRISGVADPTLRRLRKFDRVLKLTEQRLLAVQPGLGQRVALESKVPATGSARRLQALVAIGYTNRDLTKRLGVEPVTVWRITTRSKNVEVYLARKIQALFAELHMTPGPSVKARNRARKYGWVSGLAWNEGEIDNPEAVPNVGAVVQVSADERIAELHDLGITNVNQIAERLGIKRASVERQLYPSRQRREAA